MAKKISGKIVKNIGLMLVFAALAALLLSGCVQKEAALGKDETGNSESYDVKIVRFTTDKNTYSSYEALKADVVIKSGAEINEASVRLVGIKPYGYAYVDESKVVRLSRGENKIAFSAKTPACTSGCGGVYPGQYKISVEVMVGNDIVASSEREINLVG